MSIWKMTKKDIENNKIWFRPVKIKDVLKIAFELEFISSSKYTGRMV